jgi:hypothetical protein
MSDFVAIRYNGFAPHVVTKENEAMSANTAQVIPESVRQLRAQLRDLNSRRPVEPFRIHLNDGRVFDVRYSNMLIVLNTFVSIGIPEPNEPDPFVEHSVDVEMTEIRGVELLSATTSSKN